MKPKFESTYALLVRSEEKSRTILEAALYTIAILSAIGCIWQFAQTPMKASAPAAPSCDLCKVSDKAEVAGG